MRTAFVEAVAVVGSGLQDWDMAQSALRDPSTYRPGQVMTDGSDTMPPNERRRTTPVIRLVLQVMQQLQSRSTIDLSRSASVFATSWGDLQVIENMMSSLIAPGIPVSPVQFHNMVHNAPAGYWSIGARARSSSTSLTAGDGTFAAGLADAVACANSHDDECVSYVCYEHPGPAVFEDYSPINTPFAVAMLLTAKRTERSSCSVALEICPAMPETTMEYADLESLRRGNPAARSLPLLQATTRDDAQRVILSLATGKSSVAIDVVRLH
ncbi:beta-ketoacyl synthase chain length factor [Bradyrhizobium diazoefficiens]|nr:beta-ketoacyl synthase chain length factor [Bradyrhizobium diazoefficiens]MBR0701952.1 beta-ketoacyl synthase chain length factor [Bradyrhizobium diazoefficiens]MBR0770375.1 beta-ketoacyl synthase chain length factor [Bradyrhizobium diazoefficiens]